MNYKLIKIFIISSRKTHFELILSYLRMCQAVSENKKKD